jgi:pimeloyl-[acyl-carrier protein] methyl ester esterase
MSCVLLPGLDGTSTMLDGFCFELRKQGVAAWALAYPPDQPLGYSDLEAFVRPQLPKDRPFVLLGESFSGPLAIRIASDPPLGLTGLVLSTTFARSPVPLLRPLAGMTRLAPARLPSSLLYWWLLGRWATPELERALQSALRRVSPATLRARAAAALRVDVADLLHRVQVPVLCLRASHDRLLPASATRTLLKSLRACQVIHVEGPHLLLQTATKTCATAVAAFALTTPFNQPSDTGLPRDPEHQEQSCPSQRRSN